MSDEDPSFTQSLRGSARQFYVHGVKALKPNHPEVAQLQREGYQPSDFGSRIWRSSYLLIDYLSDRSFEDTNDVIELGCGWGLAGTYLQKWHDVEVTATDIDADVFPYQQLLCRHNGVAMRTQQCSLSGLCRENLKQVDLMIGADICYSETNASDLESLCHRLADQGGGELILADSGRPPFHQLAEKLAHRYAVELTPTRLELPAIASGQVLHAVMSP